MRNSTLILLILPGVLACLAGTALASGHITWKASGKGGAVAAGHPDAVAAGIRMLEADGNAADAAAATLLALSVTDYGMFAIGGEIPFLIYDAEKKEVKVLSGLGRAPLDQARHRLVLHQHHPGPGQHEGRADPRGRGPLHHRPEAVRHQVLRGSIGPGAGGPGRRIGRVASQVGRHLPETR